MWQQWSSPYDGAVIELRQFFRALISDPTKDEGFKNFNEKNLNKDLLDWDKITLERRIIYFQEIKEQVKFAQCKHKMKKINVFEESETYDEIYRDVMEIIEDEENSGKKLHFCLI